MTPLHRTSTHLNLMAGEAGEEFLILSNNQTIAAYRAKPVLLEEHVRQEAAIREGAYSRRQVYELVQNAVDALQGRRNGRIHVLLTDTALYCADNGSGLTNRGVAAVLNSYLSPKDDQEIGRYGLGFKSVLAVTDRPEVHTKRLSFRFDPEWAREVIRSATGYTGEIPVLRLARPIDREDEIARDPHLTELAVWASTIVKLPFTGRVPTWLERDIVDFPAQLLLFAPHVAELTLEHETAGVKRVLQCERGDVFRLISDRDVAEWHVFETEIGLPEDIRQDGGVFSGRETIKISWAVPAKGGSTDGRFWAFFPLDKEEMSLKGILNASWKLNDDRSNILPGRFTSYVLERAVELVFRSLPKLVDSNDPGKILELYPARLDERRGTDLALTQQFYRQARFAATVPNTSGTLCNVVDLNLHPRELTPGAVQEWLSAPDIPANWAHASCATTTVRQARIDQLRPEDKSRATLKHWLEVLAGTRQDGLGIETRVQRSARAIRAAASLVEGATREVLDQLRSAHILLTQELEYARVDPNEVFLPNPESESVIDLPLVHESIASQLDVVTCLHRLGISIVDASSELRSFVHSRGIHNLTDKDWERVWRIVDRIQRAGDGDPVSILTQLCGEHFSRLDIKVRTRVGKYRCIRDVLLPGPIVSVDGPGQDQEVTVDTVFHANHLAVLRKLGVVAEPGLSTDPALGEWYAHYRRHCIDLFIQNLRENGVQATPRDSLIHFEQREMPSPLGVLAQLSPGARVRMSRSLLRWLDQETWTMVHATSQMYPRAEVPSPVKWMLRNYGYLNTSLGPRPVTECAGPGLSAFRSLLPIADCSEREARLLGLPSHVDEIPASWVYALLHSETEPSPEMVSFWAAVCEKYPPPTRLSARAGTEFRKEKPEHIAIDWGDMNEFAMLERLEVPYVAARTKTDADRLKRHWRLKDPTSIIDKTVYYESAGEAVPVLNLFPALQLYVDQDLESLFVVPCSVLEVAYRVGTKIEPLDAAEFRDGDRLLLLMGRGHDIDLYTEETLNRVLSLIDQRLDPVARDLLLAALERSAHEQKMREVAREPDVPRKLLLTVGAETLREALPDELLRGTGDNDVAIARRFHSVFGVESLIVLKDALRDAGFLVPGTWAGSFQARRFVRQLGFPEPYAGFPSSERPNSVDVPAPVRLPPLHAFQETLVRRILGLLKPENGASRGLLSLPTGAGKTRVTVEALVRAINDGLMRGPILWIAQTDELCEQAVQSWTEVWTSYGARETLRINRLWSTGEADEYPDGPQVVVATRQKLDNVRGKAEYEWLSEAATVVIDEAHESITPSYTGILEWLGLSRSRTRCPLLGLSATPFRGGEEETRRLAGRYDHNRLDAGLFRADPYEELQRMGILSQVDHEILEGVKIPLTKEELEEIETFARLPVRTARELTLHEKRNRQIIESIKAKPRSWSILVFAVSVNHARLLAAALAEEGIPAAAISAQTAAGARRYYIERFKTGELRVLTNYGVLTTGFDAPKVEAIYVARPVFSPSLYQQMIGRGLRGPLNGGTERCLIVNVADTFERFGRDLAFRNFEYLWSRR